MAKKKSKGNNKPKKQPQLKAEENIVAESETSEMQTSQMDTNNIKDSALVVDKSAEEKKEDKKQNVKQDKKKDKKEKKPNKLAKKTKETFSELKKVSWPTFGQVVKKTGVVLAVVVIFTIVLFGIDYLLGMLFDLLTSGIPQV